MSGWLVLTASRLHRQQRALVVARNIVICGFYLLIQARQSANVLVC
jgi:hypothetical protein